jgi:lipopolysaccharide export system permease protein
MPITLFLYLARKYTLYLVTVFCITTGIVVLFESVEMIRIMFGRPIGFMTIIQMALLKNFMHIQRTFGFIALLAAILVYINLNKRSELIIMRSSGMSILQFSLPSLAIAFLFGTIYITILNPVASLFIARYEKLEAQYLKESPSLLTILKTGLWIKQVDNDKQKSIMHALRLSQENSELYETTVYFLDEDNRFIRRLDAEYAKLHDGKWALKNVIETAPNHYYQQHDNVELSTNITFNQIQESMIRPETLSFWKLPTFIALAEDSGFPVVRHKLYFYRLLISPLFFTVMALLGIAFALTQPRSGMAGKFAAIGLIIGFFIYFSSDVLFALGTAGSIPLWLAAIAPTLITFIVGTYLHLHHEDTDTARPKSHK